MILRNLLLGKGTVKYPLMQRCVTCWASGNYFFDISKPCYLNISLKEAIILLVPDMIATIKDDDTVCKKCQVTLEMSIKFIQQCLFVQEQLKSGKYKKTVEDDDINDEIPQENKTVSVDVEEAPIISLDHDYSIQNKVIQQIDETNTVISVQQSNIERLKTFVNVFSKSNIAVFDQSEHLGDEAESKRIILLGSCHNKCVYCSTQFTSLKALQIHEIFECNKNKSPIQIKAEDTKLQRSKYKYRCRFCSERFITFSLYIQHFIDKHPFCCKKCNKQFQDKSSQIIHNREFHVRGRDRNESYLCDICGKYFTFRHKFFNHIRLHKKPELTCEKCGRLYNQKIALDRHLLTHGEKLFECDRCFKKFPYSIALKRHIGRVHEPEELNTRSQCDECGKLLKSKMILASHKVLVHSKKGPFECPKCHKTYTAGYYLQRHIKLVHIGGKHSYKKAPNPNNKVTHSFTKRLRAISPRELLPCKICGKYYKGFNKLKLHLERHVPTKRFACNYCGITLKNVSSLKRHHQSHLSAKSIHRCNVCWKTLSSEEELQDHMAIHDKPRHQCEECGEFFHRKFLLNDHVLLQHTNPEDLQISLRKVIDEAIDSINKNKIEDNSDTAVVDEKYLEDYIISSEDINAIASIEDENNVELELNQNNMKVVTNNFFYHVNDLNEILYT